MVLVSPLPVEDVLDLLLNGGLNFSFHRLKGLLKVLDLSLENFEVLIFRLESLSELGFLILQLLLFYLDQVVEVVEFLEFTFNYGLAVLKAKDFGL
jgi:hypothetical protein